MVTDNGFLPLFSIARIGDTAGDMVGAAVCRERTVRVLCLDVAVNELHEKESLEIDPFLENPLSRTDRIVREEILHLCKRIHGPGYLVVAPDLLSRGVERLLVKVKGLAVYGRDRLYLAVLEVIYFRPYDRSHDIVHPVAGVGDAVAYPECRSRGICQHIAVAYGEAFRHPDNISIYRGKIGGGGIVGTEPEKSAHYVRQPSAGLAYEPETGLLIMDDTRYVIVRNRKKTHPALRMAFITFMQYATSCGEEAKSEKTLPASMKKGAPGG